MRTKTPSRPFARPVPARPVVGHRHVAIRPLTLYLGFGGLALTNVLTLVGLLMAPDIAHVLNGETANVLSAYEDRLSQLRLEVDRLQSRHYAQTGDINLQLQELAQTQEVLAEQHQYVKQLADKAAALGIAPPAGKPPAPQGDATLITGSIDGPRDPAAEVAAAAASVNSMMDDTRLAMATMSEVAESKTDQIMGALAGIGIRPKLPDSDATAEGGPLLPPIDAPDSNALIDDANAVATALDRYQAARNAADLAPVHKPISSITRVSSTFGNRPDPFTGRLAFHSGIDFAAPQGTTVRSAGHGKVTFVGQISGYGNVVEVTHDSGLITRYGHLSAFLVTEGTVVDTGTPIAQVGSTGRSTGPHLHFEVRKSDDAIDPAPFLNTGKVLQRITLAG